TPVQHRDRASALESPIIELSLAVAPAGQSARPSALESPILIFQSARPSALESPLRELSLAVAPAAERETECAREPAHRALSRCGTGGSERETECAREPHHRALSRCGKKSQYTFFYFLAARGLAAYAFTLKEEGLYTLGKFWALNEGNKLEEFMDKHLIPDEDKTKILGLMETVDELYTVFVDPTLPLFAREKLYLHTNLGFDAWMQVMELEKHTEWCKEHDLQVYHLAINLPDKFADDYLHNAERTADAMREVLSNIDKLYVLTNNAALQSFDTHLEITHSSIVAVIEFVRNNEGAVVQRNLLS
ncbi:MAG: hypothetical protein SGPRY_008450, partial [Prymnesium sp.]